jgi:hypothetical protein
VERGNCTATFTFNSSWNFSWILYVIASYYGTRKIITPFLMCESCLTLAQCGCTNCRCVSFPAGSCTSNCRYVTMVTMIVSQRYFSALSINQGQIFAPKRPIATDVADVLATLWTSLTRGGDVVRVSAGTPAVLSLSWVSPVTNADSRIAPRLSYNYLLPDCVQFACQVGVDDEGCLRHPDVVVSQRETTSRCSSVLEDTQGLLWVPGNRSWYSNLLRVGWLGVRTVVETRDIFFFAPVQTSLSPTQPPVQ